MESTKRAGRITGFCKIPEYTVTAQKSIVFDIPAINNDKFKI